VLITFRTGEEQRLRRWLADIRRLPRVREVGLERLDRVSTRNGSPNCSGARRTSPGRRRLPAR
jgi:hypothetical protein